MSGSFELKVDGGKLGHIESEFDDMFKLKNEVEKELNFFKESDENEIKIKIKKEGVS